MVYVTLKGVRENERKKMEQEFTRLRYICIGFCSIYTSLFRKDNCRLAFIRTRGDVYILGVCINSLKERTYVYVHVIRLRTYTRYTYCFPFYIVLRIKPHVVDGDLSHCEGLWHPRTLVNIEPLVLFTKRDMYRYFLDVAPLDF